MQLVNRKEFRDGTRTISRNNFSILASGGKITEQGRDAIMSLHLSITSTVSELF